MAGNGTLLWPWFIDFNICFRVVCLSILSVSTLCLKDPQIWNDAIYPEILLTLGVVRWNKLQLKDKKNSLLTINNYSFERIGGNNNISNIFIEIFALLSRYDGVHCYAGCIQVLSCYRSTRDRERTCNMNRDTLDATQSTPTPSLPRRALRISTQLNTNSELLNSTDNRLTEYFSKFASFYIF